jgi:hypothetical protein
MAATVMEQVNEHHRPRLALTYRVLPVVENFARALSVVES